MRARMELLRHFGSSSIFQSASDRPAKFSETKSFRPRSLAHTHRIDPNFARIRNVSNDLQPVKSRNNSKQGPHNRITYSHRDNAPKVRNTETTQQRPETVETSAAATTPGTPATSPSRRTDRGPAAELPGTAAATTAATPTIYRVKSVVIPGSHRPRPRT